MPYPNLTLTEPAAPALHLRSYMCSLVCIYSRIMHEKAYMSWWCKGSTLSRHVRVLGFDSLVRTLFSIDLCCIYLVFTMLFSFDKRMYSLAWCSAHGVKVARFPGMLEVSGSIAVSGICFLLIFVVFTLCLPCYSSLLSACTVTRGAPFTASCLIQT